VKTAAAVLVGPAVLAPQPSFREDERKQAYAFIASISFAVPRIAIIRFML
jgi:hypothetical protein